jgi:transposase
MKRIAAAVLREDGQRAAAVAAKLHTTPRTVERWSQRIAAQQNFAAAADAPRSGRPHKTSEEQDVNIALTSLQEPFTTPRGIKRKLMLPNISPRTIARRLDHADIPAHLARHRRHLSEEEIRARFSFAEGYEHWTEEQWAGVLFADEKCFTGEGHPGRVWVRIPRGANPLDPQYTAHKLQHPKSVPAWACFSGAGVGYMAYSYDSLKGPMLAKIFREWLVPTAQEQLGVGKQAWFLLHDNVRVHHAPAPTAALFNAGFTQIDFPPYSPDLNPIENLWADVQKRVDEMPSSTRPQLEAAVVKAWSETSTELCSKLARSMPKRIQEVIRLKGQYTHY